MNGPPVGEQLPEMPVESFNRSLFMLLLLRLRLSGHLLVKSDVPQGSILVLYYFLYTPMT